MMACKIRRTWESIIFQRKSKPQVTAPDDKQVAIPEERITNPDVQSVDLGYDALEETSDDSPDENNKTCTKVWLYLPGNIYMWSMQPQAWLWDIFEKAQESKLITTTSKAVNAAEAPDINEVNAAGAVDINEVKIAESAEEKLPECWKRTNLKRQVHYIETLYLGGRTVCWGTWEVLIRLPEIKDL